MELTPERKRSIRQRLEPHLTALDPDLHFIEVILDSERRNLGVVVQKEDRPAMLRLDFIRYVSMPESELRTTLEEQLRAKKLIGNSRR
ncbi:MAG TPA: hypothetical protein VNN18_11185 [Candidatus Xenobia bacterium]|nr:hypothetical protein [Candidatus Xenobia bacterium]